MTLVSVLSRIYLWPILPMFPYKTCLFLKCCMLAVWVLSYILVCMCVRVGLSRKFMFSTIFDDNRTCWLFCYHYCLCMCVYAIIFSRTTIAGPWVACCSCVFPIHSQQNFQKVHKYFTLLLLPFWNRKYYGCCIWCCCCCCKCLCQRHAFLMIIFIRKLFLSLVLRSFKKSLFYIFVLWEISYNIWLLTIKPPSSWNEGNKDFINLKLKLYRIKSSSLLLCLSVFRLISVL